jgi:hypothetical protein
MAEGGASVFCFAEETLAVSFYRNRGESLELDEVGVIAACISCETFANGTVLIQASRWREAKPWRSNVRLGE